MSVRRSVKADSRVPKAASKRGLAQTFLETLAANRLLGRDEPAVVGVSGGPDSVALLHLSCFAGREVVVAHFNHGLRAAESDRDEKFVHDLCRRWALDYEGARADTRQEARHAGESIEESARRLRYAFFDQVACERGIRKVLVAHTQNDQAETLLLRLLRGAGRRGLGGMRMVSGLPVPDSKIVLVRPLLRVGRRQILEYLARNRLRFRRDRSNQSENFTRNRIRHRLLPMLEREFQPAAVEVLARTAEILAHEDRMLDQRLKHFPRGMNLKRRRLLSVPDGLRGRALLGWLQSHGVASPSWERVEALLRAVEERETKSRRIQFSGGRSIRVEHGVLKMEARGR